MKFLVVDDKEIITDLLSSLLKSMGYDYACANNGLAAYELFCQESFQIVITDLMMPEMKGEELIKKIRSIDKESIIIVITGYATIEAAIEVMKGGAFDFIKKPFHLDEIRLVIKKAVEFHTLREKNKKYSEEMKIAQALRNNLLYHPKLKDKIPGFTVGVETIFLEELGGDVYNIFPLNEDNVFIYIGDVSNRGVNASLLFSMVHSLIQGLIPNSSSPKEVLSKINFSLRTYLGENTSNFVTLLAMKLNLLTNQLVYSCAGHNLPLIYRNKEIVKLLEAKEVFLGMFENVVYSEHQIQLQRDDRLILFTDGLIEARNSEGQMFGLERLGKFICENEHLSCPALAKSIGRKVIDFQNGTLLRDDITILILDITSEKVEEPVPMEESTTRIVNLEIPSVLKYRKGIVSKILSLGNELGMCNERLQDLKLVIDEAVINAIEHGNKTDRNKRVFVQCRFENDYLDMRIRDEGEGFNYEAVMSSSKDNFNLRGRGLLLIKKFADKMNHNEKGNEIIIGYRLRS